MFELWTRHWQLVYVVIVDTCSLTSMLWIELNSKWNLRRWNNSIDSLYTILHQLVAARPSSTDLGYNVSLLGREQNMFGLQRSCFSRLDSALVFSDSLSQATRSGQSTQLTVTAMAENSDSLTVCQCVSHCIDSSGKAWIISDSQHFASTGWAHRRNKIVTLQQPDRLFICKMLAQSRFKASPWLGHGFSPSLNHH